MNIKVETISPRNWKEDIGLRMLEDCECGGVKIPKGYEFHTLVFPRWLPLGGLMMIGCDGLIEKFLHGNPFVLDWVNQKISLLTHLPFEGSLIQIAGVSCVLLPVIFPRLGKFLPAILAYRYAKENGVYDPDLAFRKGLKELNIKYWRVLLLKKILQYAPSLIGM